MEKEVINMNRKGFTLVEILIVLAILALLLLILVPNVFVLINKNNEKSCESLVNNIESATKIYVTNNKYDLDIKCYDENNVNDTTLKITLNDLINSGDLTTDSSNKIINPINNTEINLDTVVEVIYNCDTKEFLYNVEGISCEKEDSIPILTVTSPTGFSMDEPTYSFVNKYTVTGTVFDEKNPIRSVTVNGVNAIIDGEGNWSVDITLDENVTTSVTVVATNNNGNQSIETRYVNYVTNIEYAEFLVTKENRYMIGYTGEQNEELVIPSIFKADDGTWYKVTGIDDMAFAYCRDLKSVIIPDGVTRIEGYAFKNCNSLTSIRIPNSVVSILYGSFENCYSLTSIDIPDSVTSIESYVFYNCSSLTSIHIPERVTNIGKFAFYNCSSLTSIHIPDGVTSIGDSAFNACNKLSDVYYGGNESDWNSIQFGADNTHLTSKNIHYNYNE